MPCTSQVSTEQLVIVNASCVARDAAIIQSGPHDASCTTHDVMSEVVEGINNASPDSVGTYDYHVANRKTSESTVPLAKLQYMPTAITGIDSTVLSLKYSSAEISVIQPRIIQHLNLPTSVESPYGV